MQCSLLFTPVNMVTVLLDTSYTVYSSVSRLIWNLIEFHDTRLDNLEMCDWLANVRTVLVRLSD